MANAIPNLIKKSACQYEYEHNCEREKVDWVIFLICSPNRIFMHYCYIWDIVKMNEFICVKISNSSTQLWETFEDTISKGLKNCICSLNKWIIQPDNPAPFGLGWIPYSSYLGSQPIGLVQKMPPTRVHCYLSF